MRRTATQSSGGRRLNDSRGEVALLDVGMRFEGLFALIDGLRRSGLSETIAPGCAVIARRTCEQHAVIAKQSYECQAIYYQGTVAATGRVGRADVERLDAAAPAGCEGWAQYVQLFSPEYHDAPVIVRPEEVGQIVFLSHDFCIICTVSESTPLASQIIDPTENEPTAHEATITVFISEMIIESQKGNRNHCWLENITGEIDRIDTRRLLVVGRARLAARRDRRQPARCAPGPRVLARIERHVPRVRNRERGEAPVNAELPDDLLRAALMNEACCVSSRVCAPEEGGAADDELNIDPPTPCE